MIQQIEFIKENTAWLCPEHYSCTLLFVTLRKWCLWKETFSSSSQDAFLLVGLKFLNSY